MRATSISFFAFIVFAAGACGGDDENPPRTKGDFCRDWASAACSDNTVKYCQAEDADACRQSQEDFCQDLVPDAFSDKVGAACISAVKAAYSDGELSGDELSTVLKLGGPCGKLTVGTKDEGETCSERSDCDVSAGYDCVLKAGDKSGTCQMPEMVEAGRDCSDKEAVCEAGFYCKEGFCVEAKELDAACTTQSECATNAYCNEEGRCAARSGVGETCAKDDECKEGICYSYNDERTCTDLIRLARSEPICSDLR